MMPENDDSIASAASIVPVDTVSKATDVEAGKTP